MSLITRAAGLMHHYHKGQERLYNKWPSEFHLIRVGGRVATRPGATERDVAGGYLHDIIEEQATSPQRHDEIIQEIMKNCGPGVMNIVIDMTNPSKGSKLSRPERKAMDRVHMRCCPKNVKVIKLIDRIDNLNEFCNDAALGVMNDMAFLEMYAEESLMLLNE